MDRSQALREVAAEVRRGELVFPTSLKAALKIRQALDDPDGSLTTAARLIESEPLLAARVVAVANSAAFNRGGQPITGVGTAVSRLGFRTTRTLAQALITRQMAGKPRVAAHSNVAVALWQHTAQVSALARVIARRVTRLDPDTALFAGLVHEVRGFYLISRADEFPSLLNGDILEDDESVEAEIGNAVLERLEVPKPVSEAILAVWNGYLAEPPITLGDTVLLAKHLAPIQSPLLVPPEQQGDRTRPTIDLQLEHETLGGILEECADEIASVSKALQF